MSLKTVEKDQYIKIDGLEYFDISQIFDCGQSFRFDEVKESGHEKEFSGVAFGRFVSFAQDGDTLYIYGADEREFHTLWKRYLGLDIDYGAIRRDIAKHCPSTVMRDAMETGRGIRILRQDPFETVVSFIVSQNNNIPRIKKIIENLSRECGEPIEVSEEMEKHVSGVSSLCAFPTAEAINSIGKEGLFELRTGFRAGYIADAIERIIDGRLDLEALKKCESNEQVMQDLCTVRGIGPKVASCISLFGLERYSSFPIDVWIKRVMQKYFPDVPEKFDPKEYFGAYAGIAQQYLFYYERYQQKMELI
ncbi:MAG: DNA-3-methyladenine glycosylase 2 family protein [Ruminococcaceae bacterium]|nr:DNA-3-methyladenine glycosylase 2 family protein [Oscillospiraceae bacterium]